MKKSHTRLKDVILLHKSSVYENYFLNRRGSSQAEHSLVFRRCLKRFKQTDENHYAALKSVEKTLRACRVSYQKYRRGQKIHYSRDAFVITVGGDGTFLEAARALKRQTILGVNSDPDWSIGRFCTADAKNFLKILKRVINNREKIKLHGRMRVQLNQEPAVNILNDILVAHQNPAAMSHYALTIGGKKEEQRSSGLWVSTAAGSSGALKSAGGRVIIKDTQAVQYRPRELYHFKKMKYRFCGGKIPYRKHFAVTSLMRRGAVYCDGAHHKLPFSFGDRLTISRSSDLLRVVKK